MEVARFTLPFSASPMETALVIAFVLPRRKGGYGLPFPQLNYPITYQGPTGKEERFFLDIYWPEYKLAVEYDSDEHHFGSLDEAYHDAGRRMQLQKMGIETLVMTKGQMQSLEALDCAVEVIKGKMGKRIRLYDPDYVKSRKALLSELLPGIYHR